jgi:hypothetical protein
MSTEDKARRLVEGAVAALMTEYARRGRIEAAGVVWDSPTEASVQRAANGPRRAAVS